MKKKQGDKKLIVLTTVYKSKMGGIKDFLIGLGKREAIDIDKVYQKKKLLGPWGLDLLVGLYQGFKKERLKDLALDYSLEYLLPGTKEFVFRAKEKGFLVGVLNANPQFMMDALKELLPLDFAIGTELEFKGGVATGRIQREVNRYVEAGILRGRKRAYELEKKDVISIGRASITHLPIAKESGVYIGFDPEKDTISKITRTIKTTKNLNDFFRK